jgi:hypothetical protein
MEAVRISRHSQNIGFGWTNQPRQTRTGLVIEAVAAPDYVGRPRAVIHEFERAVHGNSGNDWRYAFFIGGRRVVDYNSLLVWLRYPDEAGYDLEVEVE